MNLRIRRWASLAVLPLSLGLGHAALAGSTQVYQSGILNSAGNLPKMTRNGQIEDAAKNGVAGDVLGLGVNPFAITDKAGLGVCSNTAATGGAYRAMCLGHDATGNGLLSIDSYGGASNLGFNVRLNGTLYPFPGAGNGNVVGPNPTQDSEVALFNGTSGALLKRGNRQQIRFDPRDYGALCDGSTDDTTAYRATVTAFNAIGGGELDHPAGKICKVTTAGGAFVLTKGGRIVGHGIPGIGGGLGTLADSTLTGSSVLRDVSGGSNDIFQVQTGQSVEFTNFMCDAQPAKSGGACIAMQGDQPAGNGYVRGPQVHRMVFRAMYDGIRNDYTALGNFSHNFFLDYTHCGINTNILTSGSHDAGAFDYGSATIEGNHFWDLNTNAGLGGYCHFNGSLGPITNNDFTGGQYGVHVSWGGSHSEEASILGNLFDQHTKANVAFLQNGVGNDLSEIIIANNRFSTQVFSAGSALNPVYGNIYIGPGTPASFDTRWIKLGNLNSNTFNNCYDNSQGAAAYIWVRDGNAINIQGNAGSMNYAPGFEPCSAAMGAGVAAIKTEGTGYGGSTGVVACRIAGNTWIDSATFELGGLAPLCLVDDSGIKTWAIDSHLGYGRTIERRIDLGAITAWTTILTLTPSLTTSLNASGLITATLSGHTALTAFGTRLAQWQYLYTNGTPSVANFIADVCKDSAAGSSGCPQFRIVTSAANIALQVQSSNGVAALDGASALIKAELATPNGVASTFYWNLQ